MGSFASLAFGAFGNKSASFWSVLGTPKMRRGKSMDIVDNKINSIDTQYPTTNNTRQSKGRILSFLGSSAEFFSRKVRNDHHMSLESDPGYAATYVKHNAAIHQNGHIGKRLVRGGTIDTLSSDSIDDFNDKTCGETAEDYSKQETIDSSVYDGEETSSVSHNAAQGSDSMQRTQSDNTPSRPQLCRGDRIIEDTGLLDRPRSASIGATTRNLLTVNHHAYFHSMDSTNSTFGRKEDV